MKSTLSAWRLGACLLVSLFALCALCAPGVQASGLPSNLPVSPRIPPGYKPGPEAAKDTRGLWMEMDEAEKSLQHSPLVVTDPLINNYVSDIVCAVSHAYCGDLRVYVIRSPHFNAALSPNGLMLVNTGLIIRMASSDQLAAVLGHELAHYTQTHSLERLRKAKRNLTVGTLVSALGLPGVLATIGVLSFNRQQESEADELGAYYMAAAGYWPGAASEVWRLLEDEERNALVKRSRGAWFLSTHPKPVNRAQTLDAVVQRLADSPVGVQAAKADLKPQGAVMSEVDPLIDVVQRRYALLMDEQLQQRDAGRLLTLLERHEAMGIRLSDVLFYRGEAYRIRDGCGDIERAMAAYRQAIGFDEVNPGAYRELGYLEYKHGDRQRAQGYLKAFLAEEPDAPDRQMIEFYLQGGW